jgi:hypothetical protein
MKAAFVRLRGRRYANMVLERYGLSVEILKQRSVPGRPDWDKPGRHKLS